MERYKVRRSFSLVLVLVVFWQVNSTYAGPFTIEFGTPTFDWSCRGEGRSQDRDCSYSYSTINGAVDNTAEMKIFMQASADKGPFWADTAIARARLQASIPVNLSREVEFSPLDNGFYEVKTWIPTIDLEYSWTGMFALNGLSLSAPVEISPVYIDQENTDPFSFFLHGRISSEEVVHERHFTNTFGAAWWQGIGDLDDRVTLHEGYSAGETSGSLPTGFEIWEDDFAPYADYQRTGITQNYSFDLLIDDLYLATQSTAAEVILCSGKNSGLDNFDTPCISWSGWDYENGAFQISAMVNDFSEPYTFIVGGETTSRVSEPSLVSLFGAGLLGITFATWRRRRGLREC